VAELESRRWRTRRATIANFRVNRDLRELHILVECAELIVRSALQRHESRGLQPRLSDPLPVSFPTVLVREVRSHNKAVQSLGLRRRKPDSAPHKLVSRRR
jgi:hypothetical protein